MASHKDKVHRSLSPRSSSAKRRRLHDAEQEDPMEDFKLSATEEHNMETNNYTADKEVMPGLDHLRAGKKRKRKNKLQRKNSKGNSDDSATDDAQVHHLADGVSEEPPTKRHRTIQHDVDSKESKPLAKAHVSSKRQQTLVAPAYQALDPLASPSPSLDECIVPLPPRNLLERSNAPLPQTPQQEHLFVDQLERKGGDHPLSFRILPSEPYTHQEDHNEHYSVPDTVAKPVYWFLRPVHRILVKLCWSYVFLALVVGMVPPKSGCFRNNVRSPIKYQGVCATKDPTQFPTCPQYGLCFGGSVHDCRFGGKSQELEDGKDYYELSRQSTCVWTKPVKTSYAALRKTVRIWTLAHDCRQGQPSDQVKYPEPAWLEESAPQFVLTDVTKQLLKSDGNNTRIPFNVRHPVDAYAFVSMVNDVTAELSLSAMPQSPVVGRQRGWLGGQRSKTATLSSKHHIPAGTPLVGLAASAKQSWLPLPVQCWWHGMPIEKIGKPTENTTAGLESTVSMKIVPSNEGVTLAKTVPSASQELSSSMGDKKETPKNEFTRVKTPEVKSKLNSSTNTIGDNPEKQPSYNSLSVADVKSTRHQRNLTASIPDHEILQKNDSFITQNVSAHRPLSNQGNTTQQLEPTLASITKMANSTATRAPPPSAKGTRFRRIVDGVARLIQPLLASLVEGTAGIVQKLQQLFVGFVKRAKFVITNGTARQQLNVGGISKRVQDIIQTPIRKIRNATMTNRTAPPPSSTSFYLDYSAYFVYPIISLIGLMIVLGLSYQQHQTKKRQAWIPETARLREIALDLIQEATNGGWSLTHLRDAVLATVDRGSPHSTRRILERDIWPLVVQELARDCRIHSTRDISGRTGRAHTVLSWVENLERFAAEDAQLPATRQIASFAVNQDSAPTSLKSNSLAAPTECGDRFQMEEEGGENAIGEDEKDDEAPPGSGEPDGNSAPVKNNSLAAPTECGDRFQMEEEGGENAIGEDEKEDEAPPGSGETDVKSAPVARVTWAGSPSLKDLRRRRYN